VEVGGNILKAVLTPGHTKGCTTWTMTAREDEKEYRVVWVCSTSVPGYKLVGNPKYPEIVQDYRRSFATLKATACDVFLGSHGSFFDLEDKARLVRSGRNKFAFVDREGYRNYLDRSEKEFETRVQRERSK
jgi:metallo-beta-lactamase class B